MNILSVESSCDETAVAIVRDGREILTDCIASQVEIHKLYGGVVPEIASRKHIEAIYAPVSYTHLSEQQSGFPSFTPSGSSGHTAAAARRCPSCGAAIQNASSQFCTSCGAKLDAGTQCPVCGRTLEPGSRFCPDCGTDVSSYR